MIGVTVLLARSDRGRAEDHHGADQAERNSGKEKPAIGFEFAEHCSVRLAGAGAIARGEFLLEQMRTRCLKMRPRCS